MLQIAVEFRRGRELSFTFAICYTYTYVITAMAEAAFERQLAFSCERVGHANLSMKAEQKEAVWQLYNGNDVFVWLPTGYGKSLCNSLVQLLHTMASGAPNKKLHVVRSSSVASSDFSTLLDKIDAFTFLLLRL